MASDRDWDNDAGITETDLGTAGEIEKMTGEKGGSRPSDLATDADMDTDEAAGEGGTDWEDLAANSGGYEPQQKVTGTSAGSHS